MCHMPVFCWISATVLQQILLFFPGGLDEQEVYEHLSQSFGNVFSVVQHLLKYSGCNPTEDWNVAHDVETPGCLNV